MVFLDFEFRNTYIYRDKERFVGKVATVSGYTYPETGKPSDHHLSFGLNLSPALKTVFFLNFIHGNVLLKIYKMQSKLNRK